MKLVEGSILRSKSCCLATCATYSIFSTAINTQNTVGLSIYALFEHIDTTQNTARVQ